MAKDKTVLITGGTGYVGSRVAQVLAKEREVVVVDIVPPEERGIAFPSNVTFRQADLRNTGEAFRALEGGDIVLHLAADIGPLTYMQEHQADIITNNAAIDAAVYPALIANGAQWVVYSSSSMVFQFAEKFPYVEADLKDAKIPSNVYGFSKLAGEYFCRSFAAQHGLSFTIIRYHNIYGPGEDAKGSTPGDIHVIPALLEKVLGGQYPLEFLGDPASTRPFTYVDDAVEATVQIVRHALAGNAKVRNEDFNIGNDTFYSIVELGKIIWKMFGDGREFVSVAVRTPAQTALRREVDITKIRSVLEWEPNTSLADGLEATAEWIRSRAHQKSEV